MAHTIFHSPDRQEIIRRKTPLRTVREAVDRRIGARRAVLDRFTRSPQAASQTRAAGIGGLSNRDMVGDGGLQDSFDIGRDEETSRPDLSLTDMLSLSFSPSFAVQGAKELTSFGLGMLGVVNPIFGFAAQTISGAMTARGILGRQGARLSDPIGREFAGTNFGRVNVGSLTRDLATGSGGSTLGAGALGSSLTGSFSTNFGVDAFGQVSGPQSSIAGGPPGSLESIFSSDDNFGGDENDGGTNGGMGGGVGDVGAGNPGGTGVL